MAHILIMPRQGNTVESCVITDWKVKEGDSVSAETTVCEVESDKATFEVPAGEAGTVLKILHGSGDDVPVLEPIAVIGAAGENWQAAIGKQETGNEGGSPPPRSEAASGFSAPPPSGAPNNRAIAGAYGVDAETAAGRGTKNATVTENAIVPDAPKPPEPVSPVTAAADGRIAASPRARNLAEKEALPLAGVPGTGPGGRIIERDISAVLENRPGLTAAAKAAGAGSVPAAGSGIGGRVTLADLAQGAESKVTPLLSQFSAEGAITETPIKGIRKVIADRMHKSLAETAQLTLNASAPVTRLQEIRTRMKAAEGLSGELGLGKITVNDLVLFAVSRLLPRYPYLNAHKIGDTIKTFERVHLGVAVDTPRGLMVPVIRNANLLSLSQISAEAKRLAAACQNSGVKPDELSGSTFTITNLGSLGITSFTPVLNAPEVGILGVCGIELKPVALPLGETTECNGGARFEPHIGFSLTINHQVVDGAPAARFLKALSEAVANIDLLLAAG
jgi:pyruvate dehydrogenase E2 component (dihydrolipoamide acetyltransferase)